MEKLSRYCWLADYFRNQCRGNFATSAHKTGSIPSSQLIFYCLFGTVQLLSSRDGGGHPEVVPFLVVRFSPATLRGAVDFLVGVDGTFIAFVQQFVRGNNLEV